MAPPGTPVWKAVSHIAYDREEVGGPNCCASFFVDCRRTANGIEKDAAYTNMFQAGQLGYPLIMDAVRIGIWPVTDDEEYANAFEHFVRSDYELAFVVGQNTRLHASPLALMKHVSPAEEFLLKDANADARYRVKVVDGKLVADPIMPLFDKEYRGCSYREVPPYLLPRFLDVRRHDPAGRRLALRIDSTTAFRVEIRRSSPLGGKGIDVFVGIEGTLYQT